MSISDAPLVPETAEAAGGTHGDDDLIAVLTTLWRSFVKTMPERYRPERHYMRGPGPAYARKYLQHHH